jgi:hypothetical protein
MNVVSRAGNVVSAAGSGGGLPGPGWVASAVKASRSSSARPSASASPPQVVLTAADGLSSPTDVAVRQDTIYVTSAAYFTPATGPNLLIAHLHR